MIYHALHCSKIATNNSHHLPNEQLQFLCIKTLYLQSVYEINSEWLETLQLAGAIGVHRLLCSLTSASPPVAKIIDRRKTFIDLASFRLF